MCPNVWLGISSSSSAVGNIIIILIIDCCHKNSILYIGFSRVPRWQSHIGVNSTTGRNPPLYRTLTLYTWTNTYRHAETRRNQQRKARHTLLILLVTLSVLWVNVYTLHLIAMVATQKTTGTQTKTKASYAIDPIILSSTFTSLLGGKEKSFGCHDWMSTSGVTGKKYVLSGEAPPRFLEVCTVAMLGFTRTTSMPSSFNAFIACNSRIRPVRNKSMDVNTVFIFKKNRVPIFDTESKGAHSTGCSTDGFDSIWVHRYKIGI